MSPDETARPAVSVIVATRDRPALLASTLEDLRRHTRATDEIIVVDSASRDPAVGRIAAEAGIRVVRVRVPGTSRARNAGLDAARAPIVAYIDDDCSVTSGWAERIEASFDDPAVGFVTGRVVADRNASLQSSVFLEAEPRRFVETADPAGYGVGSNMAFRREALAQIGGFDEGMGPATKLRAAEDQDVFWRVVGAGWAGVYDPGIEVVHRQWRTARQAIGREYAYGVGAGALAIKLIRMGDPNGRALLRSRLWRHGIVLLFRNAARGYKSGTAAALLRTIGVLVGVARAAVTPLRDGRFRSWPSRG